MISKQIKQLLQQTNQSLKHAMTDLADNPDCYKQTAITRSFQPEITAEMGTLRSGRQSTSNSINALIKSNRVKELLKVKLTQTELENINQIIYSLVMHEVKVVLDKVIRWVGALEKKKLIPIIRNCKKYSRKLI